MGFAVKARKKDNFISLMARCAMLVAAWPPPVQVVLNGLAGEL
jgi:hypothetical protein